MCWCALHSSERHILVQVQYTCRLLLTHFNFAENERKRLGDGRNLTGAMAMLEEQLLLTYNQHRLRKRYIYFTINGKELRKTFVGCS